MTIEIENASFETNQQPLKNLWQDFEKENQHLNETEKDEAFYAYYLKQRADRDEEIKAPEENTPQQKTTNQEKPKTLEVNVGGKSDDSMKNINQPENPYEKEGKIELEETYKYFNQHLNYVEKRGLSQGVSNFINRKEAVFENKEDQSKIHVYKSKLKIDPTPTNIQASLDLAKDKGWTTIRITGGSKENRAQLWLQAQLQGFDTRGYKPTKADIKLLRGALERQQEQQAEQTQNTVKEDLEIKPKSEALEQETKAPEQEAKAPEQEAKAPEQEAKAPEQEAKVESQEEKNQKTIDKFMEKLSNGEQWKEIESLKEHNPEFAKQLNQAIYKQAESDVQKIMNRRLSPREFQSLNDESRNEREEMHAKEDHEMGNREWLSKEYQQFFKEINTKEMQKLFEAHVKDPANEELKRKQESLMEHSYNAKKVHEQLLKEFSKKISEEVRNNPSVELIEKVQQYKEYLNYNNSRQDSFEYNYNQANKAKAFEKSKQTVQETKPHEKKEKNSEQKIKTSEQKLSSTEKLIDKKSKEIMNIYLNYLPNTNLDQIKKIEQELKNEMSNIVKEKGESSLNEFIDKRKQEISEELKIQPIELPPLKSEQELSPTEKLVKKGTEEIMGTYFKNNPNVDMGTVREVEQQIKNKIHSIVTEKGENSLNEFINKAKKGTPILAQKLQQTVNKEQAQAKQQQRQKENSKTR